MHKVGDNMEKDMQRKKVGSPDRTLRRTQDLVNFCSRSSNWPTEMEEDLRTRFSIMKGQCQLRGLQVTE